MGSLRLYDDLIGPCGLRMRTGFYYSDLGAGRDTDRCPQMRRTQCGLLTKK